MKLDKPTPDGNAGGRERDRDVGWRTQRRTREFVAGGDVERAARDAERSVERDPDDAARAAARARRGPHSTWVSLDELVAKSHTVIDRIEALVRRIAGRSGSRSGRR